MAWSSIALGAWTLGAAVALLWFALRQRSFTRRLARRPGRDFDSVEGEGPALTGWWRPRIVLPQDFRQRYTRGERRLVLAHEIAHLRAGDIHAQAFATALRCLFWFNPLVHLGAAAFRFDQELACDAAVLGRFPRGRARYGSAMLKTQLAVTGLPVGCHWQSSHPLKERIEMLKHPLPPRPRKLAGAILVAMLVASASYAAWASQPAPASPSKPAGAGATKPATAGGADYLHRIAAGDDLTPPPYPKGQTAHGKVLLELLVGTDGKVKDVKIVESEPAGVFDQVSVEAARKWRISPELKDGVPVERRVLAPIEFHPDGAPKAD
jgi:TonB family protein